MTNIFDRIKCSPRQLRTVADRRYDDARYLERSAVNKHANGTMYLGGFVVECLLKAELLEQYSWLQSAGDVSRRSKFEQKLYYLCFKSHDLGSILEHLPELRTALAAVDNGRLLETLVSICSQWTIFARYSPQQATMNEARQFLDQIKELKRWLR